MFEIVCAFAASAPRAELFMYASRSATRCSSEGALGAGEVGAGLGAVWARSEQQIATATINKRIRIITKIFRGAFRIKVKDGTTLTIDSVSRVWSMLMECFDRRALTPSANL